MEVLSKNSSYVLLMDIKMNKLVGIQTTKQLLEKYPDVKIIALSMFDEGEFLEEMLQAGAMGYLLKNVDKSELEKALQAVCEGRNYFCQEMISVVTNSLLHKKTEDKTKDAFSSFTERELEILQLVCQGLNNIEIGKKLGLSPRTVGGHRNNMLAKSGLKNTAALVSSAISTKLFSK